MLRRNEFNSTQCALAIVDSACEKLEKLKRIVFRRVGNFEKLPNLKKLGISMVCTDVVDLACLYKLESLNIEHFGGSSGRHSITFPVHLKKLTLSKSVIDKELTETIGRLSMLKVLKIRDFSSFTFEEGDAVHPSLTFETRSGGFLSLQFLELGIYNMHQMVTDETHFPCLRHLVIGLCRNLKEMPECIGDIETLVNIVIAKCVHKERQSLISSLTRIQENQHEMGNYSLQVHVVRDVRGWRPPNNNTTG